MTIVLIAFIFFFLILALTRLDFALFLIIALLPAYLIRFSVLSLPLTLLEAMIIIAFAVWFIKNFLPYLRDLLKKRAARVPYPFGGEIILIIILSFLAAGVADFSHGALGIWKAYFFEPLLVFILIFNVFKEKKDWSKIFWALLLSAAGISLMAIYQKISGQFIFNPFWAQAETRRVVSFFGYPNAVGLYLAPLVMLFIGWFFSWPKRTLLTKALQKIAIILTVAISVLAIYFAHSEGAIIGLAAGLIVFGLLAGKKQRLATIILLFIIGCGILLNMPAKNLVITKLSLNDLSGQIRQRQWKETFLMLNGVKFFTGAGLDNYQLAVKPYHQEGIFFNGDNLPNFDAQLRASSTLRAKYWQPVEIYMYPHNIFLNFWSELGLLGALVFTWLIFKYLYISLKLFISYSREKKPERYLALGLLSAMLVVIIHGLVDVPYFKNDLAVLFWILIALVGGLNWQEKFGSKKIRE